MRGEGKALSAPLLGLNVEQRYRWIYKPSVLVASLLPLGWIACNLFGWLGYAPAVDPVKFLELEFGQTALNFIMLTLMITPVRLLTGYTHLLRLRRMMGLLAFTYAVLHFTVYTVLDLDLDWHAIGSDIAKRPYITVGFAAFVFLIPLAATSTNGMRRRLGRGWVKLHRLVYIIAVLSLVHFYWQEKLDEREPLLYAMVLAVLLGYRLVRAARRNRSGAPASRSRSVLLRHRNDNDP